MRIWDGGYGIARAILAFVLLLYGCGSFFLGFRRGKQRRVLSTQVTAGEKTVLFRSLLDTGNLLRDPLTGTPVLVADREVAEKLLHVGKRQLDRPTELIRDLMETMPELAPRLIPFRTVGRDHGLLLGIRCAELWIDGRRQKSGILAFISGDFSEDGSYHGLTGGT